MTDRDEELGICKKKVVEATESLNSVRAPGGDEMYPETVKALHDSGAGTAKGRLKPIGGFFYAAQADLQNSPSNRPIGLTSVLGKKFEYFEEICGGKGGNHVWMLGVVKENDEHGDLEEKEVGPPQFLMWHGCVKVYIFCN